MSRIALHVGVAAATIFLCYGALAGVCINEVGYHMDPSGDTGKEWIEIYNRGPEPADLSGFDLYPGRSPHYIFPAGFVLWPGRFVLVHLRLDGANTERDLYEGTSGVASNMPNTRASAALFTDASRDTIVDFMQYGAAGQTYQATAAAAGIWTTGDFVDTAACGWSLGLRADGADSNQPADWQGFAKPTPGYSNVPPPYDVELTALTTEPAAVPAAHPFAVSASIANAGLNAASGIALTVFSDDDGDSVCGSGERVWATAQAALCSTSIELRVTMPGLPEGRYELAAAARCSLDEYGWNNYRSLNLTAGSPIVFNEVMYTPPPVQAEWIEVFNRSGMAIDLRRWTIEDAAAQPRLLDTLSRPLGPGQYAIITENADQPPAACLRLEPIGTWPSLNNDGDLIVLRDGRGAIEDQARFYSSWGGEDGRSLERVNPFLDPAQASSWGGCVSEYRSTPGAANSIYIDKPAAGAEADAAPNPFSPDGDGHQDRTIVFFSLPWTRSEVTVKIFDRLGRLVRAPAVRREFAQEGSLVWDGRDEGGKVCPMGIYIVLLEAKEQGGPGSLRKRFPLALAGRL